jgi:hypothetical protein
MLVFGLSIGTVSATGQDTVTFDNVPGIADHTELTGEFPQGVINWGSGSWYLSGPWQDLHNNSISFTEGTDTASFSFVSEHQLVKLDAYNGGDAPASLKLSCPGQTERLFQMDAGELKTLDTGWSGNCAQVTVFTSNGWYTNFDNLVIK